MYIYWLARSENLSKVNVFPDSEKTCHTLCCGTIIMFNVLYISARKNVPEKRIYFPKLR